jgi:hypothetical protein
VKPLAPPDPGTLARLRAFSERQLSAEEVRAALVQPIGEAEEEETLSLIRWFRRRYSTQAERLAYAPARHATCSAYSTGLVLAPMAMGAIS